MSEWKRQFEDLVAPAVARSRHIDRILVDRDALSLAGSVFRECFGVERAFLIADENTMAAAGARLTGVLKADGVAVDRMLLPREPRPKPTLALAQEVRARWQATDGEAVPVSVGSGVITDIVKHAAFMEGRPFFCVATAASMDGYASAGAPLVEDGFKHTIPCAPPRAILADLDVIAAAPAEMTGWGYGDLAGKVPAGGDWILADALGVEPLDTVAWPLVQDRLRDWLADPAALAASDPAATAGLFAGLTVTGLAMEFHGSSRPASGADHQIAHLWEMENLSHDGLPVSHGACVAVGTLATLALFDWLLDQDLTRLDKDRVLAARPGPDAIETAIRQAFPEPAVAERALAETMSKLPARETQAERLERIVETWPTLCDRLKAQLVSAAEMRRLLAAAGAPASAGAIGLDPAHYKATVLRARFMRRRYTVLDFLAETGLLGAATDAVFESAAAP